MFVKYSLSETEIKSNNYPFKIACLYYVWINEKQDK